MASAAATRGLPMLAAYCAAKAGVAGLIRALAAELGGTGITANAVSPGSTATPILDESARLYGLPDAQAFAAQQPIGRLLDPAEVAAVLAFLASPASSGMTGAVVPVDGGAWPHPRTPALRTSATPRPRLRPPATSARRRIRHGRDRST